MQGDIAKLRSEQQLLQANSLIGRTVKVQDDQGAVTAGSVESVSVQEGSPNIVVNGHPYTLSQLLTVSPAAP
jgi:flagellar basal-body rod modification protein FlgD